MNQNIQKHLRRVDLQVSILTALVVIFSSFVVVIIHHEMTYNDMIQSLNERVYSIYNYIDTFLDKTTFLDINTKKDSAKSSYQKMQTLLNNIKQATGVEYLYTAKKNENNEFIYIVDGLDTNASDFRNPGDLIETEIWNEMQKALNGQIVLPNEIQNTEWGKIFITYFPVHDNNKIVGVLGIEFNAEHQFNTYHGLKIITPIIVLLACSFSIIFAVVFFRRISNLTYQDMANTDQLTQLKNQNSFNIDMKNIKVLNHNADIGIIIMDLNNLKKVNDTYGHEVGDTYICNTAKVLRECVEKNMVPYRIGGDEFSIFCYDATPETIKAFIKKVETNFENYKIEGDIPTSISSGYALFNQKEDENIYTIIRRADKDMYKNKQIFHNKKI